MPTDNHVKKAFSLIENDKSKVLGLTAGDQAIQPGQYLARSCPYFSLLQLIALDLTRLSCSISPKTLI